MIPHKYHSLLSKSVWQVSPFCHQGAINEASANVSDSSKTLRLDTNPKREDTGQLFLSPLALPP